MPPIEQAEFLQRFMTMLEAAGAPRVAPTGLTPPMAALDATPRPYAEVYGPEGLLAACAALAGAEGDPGMADLMAALDKALQAGALEIRAAPEPAPRLKRFVYPVI